MDTDPYIELRSGAKFYPSRPGDNKWNIDDIAHSLAMQCRYTGHSRHFYSVAEHSLLCSLLAEELDTADAFECLMHDAHESVIGDMSSPWKPVLPDYNAAEAIVEQSMRQAFELPPAITEEAKRIDYLAMFIEAYYLIQSKGQDWIDRMDVRVDALRLVKRHGWRVTGLDPEQAKNAFLRRYNDLVKRRPEPWWKQLDADENGQKSLMG